MQYIKYDVATNTLNGKPCTAATMLEFGLQDVIANMKAHHPRWDEQFTALCAMWETWHELNDEMRAEILAAFVQVKLIQARNSKCHGQNQDLGRNSSLDN